MDKCQISGALRKNFLISEQVILRSMQFYYATISTLSINIKGEENIWSLFSVLDLVIQREKQPML